MKFRDLYLKIFLTALVLPIVVSCEKGPDGKKSFGSRIGVSVIDTRTKSDAPAAPGAFIYERIVASFDGYGLQVRVMTKSPQ